MGTRAQGLAELGYEIVSTGGSATAIEAAGVPVKRVEELTGFPEMLDGETFIIKFSFESESTHGHRWQLPTAAAAAAAAPAAR